MIRDPIARPRSGQFFSQPLAAKNRRGYSPTSSSYHHDSHSPTRIRDVSDGLISRLSPTNALETLRNAPLGGGLRQCLDNATGGEKQVAYRTAVAGKRIWDYLEELRTWEWDNLGGRGFESRRAGGEYVGCLPVAVVEKYERRVEEVSQELEDMGIEELKGHVLYNHILPLSRPGTPAQGGRATPMPSIASFLMMDDLTAVVTATVVQMLPNLSRLQALLSVWTVRLSVLRQVPEFIAQLEDAEGAVKAAWNAAANVPFVERGSSETTVSETPSTSALTRDDFEMLRSALQNKVTSAGRTLDTMLDTLEGRDDTLPDVWCDRMDEVERSYARWALVFECAVREMRKLVNDEAVARNSDVNPGAQRGSSIKESADDAATPVHDVRHSKVWTQQLDATARSPRVLVTHHDETDEMGGVPVSLSDAMTSPATEQAADETVALPALVALPAATVSEIGSDSKETHESAETAAASLEAPLFPSQDETEEAEGGARLGNGTHEEALPQRRESASATATEEHEAMRPRTSDSNASVIRHGLDQESTIHASEPMTPANAVFSADANSMTSSETPIQSIEPVDQTFGTPVIAEEGFEDDDPYLESPSVANSETQSRLRSPSLVSEASTGDERLQRQISGILENIPAKFHLSGKTVNHLNPPDLHLPYSKPRPTPDRFPRSQSSLSNASRASTPSFMLAPASRPRHQRGNQEIKLYHLSRSTGEAPIKLFIRCVGENGERVMVRVGGGWADLGEYLKEYAIHHQRRSHAGGSESKVEITEPPKSTAGGLAGSSPPSRPASALGSPMTPLNVRKARRSGGAEDFFGGARTAANGVDAARNPRVMSSPITAPSPDTPGLGAYNPSRSSSRLSWTEEEGNALGMAGPKSLKKGVIDEESKAWVETVKEKVRVASGSRATPEPILMPAMPMRPQSQQTVRPGSKEKEGGGQGGFGELGKVGGTKRLFRKGAGK